MLNEVAIVTGAGSGLGRAVARALAGSGRRVVLVGRKADTLAETVALCTASGAGADACLAVAADVTEPAAPRRIVDETVERFGRIDVLVNNAAVARAAAFEQAGAELLELMLSTNLVAPAAMIQAAVPALRATGGVVVNVGSIGGRLALPGRAHYGASKAALHHLTGSLARELAPEIRVNAVIPGAIDTGMYETLGLGPDEVAALKEEMVRTTPLGRMGTVDDVVPWIELLVGPAGRWVTGSLIVVDGGRSC